MTDVYLPKKNIVMDATLMSSLMGCARFVDIRFNHQLETNRGKSNSLECGSIVHIYLEFYYRSIIDGYDKKTAHANGMVAAETYIKGCHHCTDFIPTEGNPKPDCGHHPNQFPGVKNTPPESEKFTVGWKYVLDTCEQYHEFYSNDHWVPLEVEVVKSKILYEDDEIRILWKAKLDLVADTNQAIYPVDHKTMKQRRDTTTLNNQFIGQCLIMGTRNAVVNKIGFQSSLKPVDKFTRSLMSYSADRLLEWQSEILPYYAYQLVSFTENNHWPPNFDHCESKFGICQYKQVCEADRNMREEELRTGYVVTPEWNPVNEE